jgi:hypothetical protein
MRDLVHETQYGLNILRIDLVRDFQAFADQPQNFQATKDDLMVPGKYCRGAHEYPCKIAATLYSKI